MELFLHMTVWCLKHRRDKFAFTFYVTHVTAVSVNFKFMIPCIVSLY